MEFTELIVKLQNNFKELTQTATHLFEVELDKEELWNLYLDSYPAGTNEIFRERREYDCSSCRQFIKNIGTAVVIKDNKVHTIWDFETGSSTYQPVLNALSSFIKSKVVTDVYVTKFNKIGTIKNYEALEDGKILEFNHFYLELPARLVDKSSKSEGEIKGSLRSTRDVFKRSLEEISKESVLTVLELTSQKSLYKGDEWVAVLNEFLKYKDAYDLLTNETEKANFTWTQSLLAGAAISRIKNHSIGTLLVNITEGMDLDLAVKKYEAIVAPSNYKRPKAVFTEKMLNDAKKKIEELGYMDSLSRRYAKLDDITVNNILFSNRDSAKRISGADVFGDMKKSLPVNVKKFSKVEEISIEDFVSNVLPSSNEIEVLLENKHASNMVSLIAPINKDSKTMFKWNNNFGWAYSGNITDSDIRDNVKSAGGAVDGVLRFSIQWNDLDNDMNDLDAHCVTPDGNRIYFGCCEDWKTKGVLDVDIRNPRTGTPAVENITWPSKSKMTKGTYKFAVNNYSHRGGRKGFRAEIEFDGQIHSFDYSKELNQNETVFVAEVVFDKEFEIKPLLQSSASGREIWGIQTNQFNPVTVVMNSPNYWDEQSGIGHKHYFFMLNNCKNTESPNGFFNEFLNQELAEHKRVFEALGSRLAVQNTEDQLSGVGFSSTKRAELIVKVKGQSERLLKIKF